MSINQIIIIDNSIEISKIKNLELSNSKIITVDYEIHKKLNDEKIEHFISDDFLDQKLLIKIQKESYKIAKWYNTPEISEKITYNSINLGGLFYIEFHAFMIPFLKKLFEIYYICKEYKNYKIFTSKNLISIIKKHTSDFECINPESLENSDFLYDSLPITKKIWNQNLKINLSRKNIKQIKNFSENFMKKILDVDKRISKNNKSVLFVEFDLNKFQNLFLHPQKKFNFILYNRRRPIFINKKSINILKDSKCSYISENNFKKYRKNDFEVSQIINLIENSGELKKLFEIDSINFWDELKPKLINLSKKRIPEAITEIDYAKQIFEKYQFSSMVILSESGFNEQIVIELAKKQGIPIILLQHGMGPESRETLNLKKFDGVWPIKSDYICVWGNIVRKISSENGINENKIIEVGNPVFDNLSKCKNKEYVLLTTSWLTNNQIFDYSAKKILNYEKTIEEIAKIIKKLNLELVVKLHPAPSERDVGKSISKTMPKARIVKDGNIHELINNCRLMIVTDFSTTILEGTLFEKPVISVRIKEEYYGTPIVFEKNGCHVSTINELDESIEKILKDKDFEKSLLAKQKKFLKQYVSHINNSTDKFIEFISKL
ncbi:UDP-N-acetylglucosamine 2-epimerase [Nitrosopumilus maritimus]|uniref:UDP-N-acetylglucosamine 2-epimerase domain-containing protein n=1 Tax=Nitrosopumilus maritimus (strain SCM1) TaxID=436308 RepID=A9A1R8_NITMS|nr:UDP-N-acetylglucosamine 2-epimerase [Nitrosopumilus maritimus]ABX12039.1 hypothetical protein Nmar_0139 [Nitrosopumilus maritimus SCM1]